MNTLTEASMKKSAGWSKILPVFMAFFVMGFVDIVGTATAYVKRDFELSETFAQLLPMMIFIWFAILSVPVGIFQSKRGKKKTLLIGIFVTLIAMTLPFLFYNYSLILMSFILIGIGNTIIQVASPPLLYEVSNKDKYSSNMSFSQLIKAVTALLGPIATAEIAKLTGDWKLIFLTYAIASLVVGLWLFFTRIPETRQEKSVASVKSSLSLLKDPFIAFMTIGSFMIVGIDVGLNTGIPNYLISQFNVDLTGGTQGISFYFGSLIIGRFLGGLVLRVIPSTRFFLLSVIIGLAGLAGMILAPDVWVARMAIVMAGLGTANIFPVIFTFAVEHKPAKSNEISGLMIMAVAGGAVMPFIMGLVSDSLGALAGLFVPALCLSYFIFVSRLIKKPKHVS